jgi:hypothetical protein
MAHRRTLGGCPRCEHMTMRVADGIGRALSHRMFLPAEWRHLRLKVARVNVRALADCGRHQSCVAAPGDGSEPALHLRPLPAHARDDSRGSGVGGGQEGSQVTLHGHSNAVHRCEPWSVCLGGQGHGPGGTLWFREGRLVLCGGVMPCEDKVRGARVIRQTCGAPCSTGRPKKPCGCGCWVPL